MGFAHKNAIVVTTINPPTRAILELAQGNHEWPLIVVGDNKTPEPWVLDGSRFLSIEEQRRQPGRLSAMLPENHYCRKNLGYLEAISSGASRIAETDDDNFPVDWQLNSSSRQQTGTLVGHQGWFNVYEYFTDDFVWPRGFPLQELNPATSVGATAGNESSWVSSVHQYLAAGDPDVDAIYRLTVGKTDHKFRSGVVGLQAGTIVPFNSQSTIWFEPAFAYMYLPSFVSFRMTDIWRSFVAQVCLWSRGDMVTYHGNGVYQERNEHDLMRDFHDEVVGYERNAEIMERLMSLNLSGSDSQRLVACYNELCRIGVVPEKELALVDAWVSDFEAAAAAGRTLR